MRWNPEKFSFLQYSETAILENGADVNALHAARASHEGPEDIAQMLLENGTEIDAEGGEYGNSLQAACYHGYEKVVQVMLEMGARVNVQGVGISNAL